MKHCIIVGGGIIGLCSAYYLQKEGHQVTVLDQSDFSNGASYVNAGIITPSHIIPLAAPGIITKGIKWMFNPASPFHIKPRLNYDFLYWSWLFKKASTKQKVAQAIPVLKEINLFSRELYKEIKESKDFDFFFQHKGLMMYYRTDKAGEEEWKTAQLAIQEGLKVEHLTQEEAQNREPGISLNIKGAIHYQSDAHMTPNEFMKGLRTYLQQSGVAILTDEEVIDFNLSANKVVSVITKRNTFSGDEIIIAAGSWTQKIVKKLNIRIPVEAGKGYGINVERETGISIPAILMEAKVAVSPMNGFTRFGGVIEMSGINHKINHAQVDLITKSVENYYEGLTVKPSEKKQVSCGLRPCSPDGLPYIGRLSRIKNVTVAAGHTMMGWSLGPATGKLISEMLSEKKPTLDLSRFQVERYN